MKAQNTSIFMQNKDIVGVLLGTGLVLLIPFVVMQMTSEMNWDESDFIVIGALLLSMGMVFVFLTRTFQNSKQRAFIALGVIAITLYIWAELAVGIFTNWGS